MKWIGISGSSQKVDERIERDVRAAVQAIFKQGDSVVTGGAAGVDYFAADEMMKLDPSGKRLHIIIPNSLSVYLSHFTNNWIEYAGSQENAKRVIQQLTSIAKINSSTIREMGLAPDIGDDVFLSLRNAEIVKKADELWAFQVNKSSGTQDTIDKARAKKILVNLVEYSIKG
jgi:hypothetical protein